MAQTQAKIVLVEQLVNLVQSAAYMGEYNCADLSFAQSALLHYATEMLSSLLEDLENEN